MKRSMIWFLSALLALTMAGSALAEAPATETITAEVLEIRQDGGMRVKASGQELIVVAGEGCTYDAYNGIYPGDTIRVTYNGVMTASIPPQATATAITCHWVEGVVEEMNDQTNQVLLRDASIGQVWVTMPDGVDATELVGQTIRAYYNGVMALSMPPQIHAIRVR